MRERWTSPDHPTLGARRFGESPLDRLHSYYLAVHRWGFRACVLLPPTVDRATVFIDTVKRGEMIREVRGIGTLVPVDIRWIAAQSSARVDKIILQSGASVKPESVILELSDPQLQRDVLDAEYAYKAAEADLTNLKAQLANDLMMQKSAAAVIESDYQQAKLQAEADRQLASQGLGSQHTC